MKIALIGYEANIKNRVGSNQYAFELLKALYRLDRENQYLVYLPSAPLPDLPKAKKNWQYRVVGPKRLWNFWGLPLALFQEKPKPDVVFNPGHYTSLFSPAPLVVAVMDLGFLRFPSQFTRPVYLKLKFWTRFSVKRAKLVLAISNSTRDDIIKWYKVDREKVLVTLLGYDQKRFHPGIKKSRLEAVEKKYGLKNDYLLFLGTLKPNKNLKGLIEAFAGLEEKNLDLVIAGRKGWLFESVFAKVESLNLKKRVLFPGFVKEKDKAALMAGAKVFVLPSFWEGFGIPALEAMACGTPVVASKVGSLPEVVGAAGVLVNPDKPLAIARGIKKALKKEVFFSKKGPVQAKNFSWEKCAKKTLEGLKRVVKNN